MQKQESNIIAESIEKSFAASENTLDWHRLYTAEEVAALLGLSRKRTVYDIPEHDLPRRWVGPQRGSLRFYGLDILCYIHQLPPVDMGEVIDALRSQISRPAGVRPMPSKGGEVRVL